MIKRFSTNFMVFLFLMDVALTQVALQLARFARVHLPLRHPVSSQAVPLELGVYALVALVWIFHFVLHSAYDPKRVLRWVDEFQLVALATTIAGLTLAGLLYLTYREVPRLLFIYFCLIDLVLLIGYRAMIRAYYRLRRKLEPRSGAQVLMVGAGEVGCEAADRLEKYRWTGLELVGFVDDDRAKQGREIAGYPVLGTLDDTSQVVQDHGIDEVLIALPLRAHDRMANLIAELHKLPVRIKVIPDYFAFAFIRARVEEMAGMPVIGLREPAIDGLQRFVKRLFDLAVTTAVLMMSWPVFLVIAVLIRLDSPGPVIFKQLRVGENGKLFWMYKFRSMIADAEKRQHEVIRHTEDGKIIHKVKEDPRRTRVGRFLRRTTLDELPNLFNVLKGEMTLVGPRPELPWLVEQYEPWQRQRFAVPQGMANWWLINGRSDKPMHLHTEDDLYYIQHYSLLLDLQILWKAIGVVLKGRGAF